MKLSDIKTLQKVSMEYKIPVSTLKTRLKSTNFNLIEDVDFRRMGKGQGVLLTPKGVEKITKTKGEIKMNIKKIKNGLIVLGVSIINSKTVLAAPDAATVTAKVNAGLAVIQGILTGIIVVVGVIAALKVIISKLPSLDDPHVKNEMWQSVGTIGLAVAVGGSLVWLIPWVYALFQ